MKKFCISFKKSAKINSFRAGFEIQQNFGTPAAKATIFLYKWNLVQKKNLAPLSFLQFYCCASLKAVKISGLFSSGYILKTLQSHPILGDNYNLRNGKITKWYEVSKYLQIYTLRNGNLYFTK